MKLAYLPVRVFELTRFKSLWINVARKNIQVVDYDASTINVKYPVRLTLKIKHTFKKGHGARTTALSVFRNSCFALEDRQRRTSWVPKVEDKIV